MAASLGPQGFSRRSVNHTRATLALVALLFSAPALAADRSGPLQYTNQQLTLTPDAPEATEEKPLRLIGGATRVRAIAPSAYCEAADGRITWARVRCVFRVDDAEGHTLHRRGHRPLDPEPAPFTFPGPGLVVDGHRAVWSCRAEEALREPVVCQGTTSMVVR